MAFSEDEIRNVLDEYAGIGPAPLPRQSSLRDLRRGRRAPRRPDARVALVERDGVVFWEWGYGIARASYPGGPLRRAGRRDAPARSKEVFSRELAPLGVNQIQEFLLAFDRQRNPAMDPKQCWTLRQWQSATQAWGDLSEPRREGKLLVIVHGTASSCDHILSELTKAPQGPKLLADAANHYAAVLGFDHPTIAFSPILNALDLAKALERYAGCDVDIVCHSRGGLVSSWWMNMVDSRPRDRRCVFVGSPLQGTSLANPARLRSSLHLLANYGRVLGHLGDGAGLLALPFTIIKVAASVVDFTASVPLLDAALAMIPGLCAQSRIDHNQELLRLNQRKSKRDGKPSQFYIQANFSPTDPGWKFWRYFTDDPKLRLTDAAVDKFIFSGPNDLVVDTEAMMDEVGGPTFKFEGADASVHHTNYFQQGKTIELIREWLEIP